jgi:hypothetical protein
MDRAAISFFLSILGAATGIPLAIMKAIEFYQTQRISFAADVRLTSSEEIGNTVILLNKSNLPATIAYFDLAWIEPRSLFGWSVPFTRKVVSEQSPLDPPYEYYQTVPPHGTHHLSFTDENHFDWGAGLKQDIYLRLWLMGRSSPIWILVTKADKASPVPLAP